MLEYKLKENSIKTDSKEPIKDYLRSLGIKKVESFLNIPPIEDELDPFLLDNMAECIAELHEGFTHNKKFFVQVDSDVDGMTSASIFYRYFKNYYPNANIVWRLHKGKEHGVIIDTVPADVDYVILPDSGSVQLEEQKILADAGKKVIILDHHQVDSKLENKNVILVNNQVSENFSNKSLSGAGVVFKTIQAYSKVYPNEKVDYKHFYDLAALGILSDMMDMRDLDNNYIVYQGLHNIKNKMFTGLLQQQAYSISNIEVPTKIDVVFYVSPLINGVIRAGSDEDKNILFLGFIEEPTQPIITSTWRNIERKETFYEYVARNSYNVKNRQDTMKNKCFEFLKSKIKKNGLDKNQIIVVTTSNSDEVEVPQNITGLIAMELLKYYDKPTLVLRPKVEENRILYAGSGRGKQAQDFSSFLKFVKESQYTVFGEGHDMAFGAAITKENIDNFIVESNEKLKDVCFGNAFVEVDAIFNMKNINYNMLYEFGKHNDLYGNSIPLPKIAIKGIIHKSNVGLIGADKTTVRINIGNLSCIKFKDKELAANLNNSDTNEVVIIGRPEINTWMGRESIQLKIDEIEVKPIKLASLF